MPQNEAKQARNVLFVVKAMANQGGGAERVLAEVASGLARRGHQVAILSSDPAGSTPFYTLDDRVKLLGLGIGNVVASTSVRELCRRIWRFRSMVRTLSPDVVVGFMHSTYLPLGIALLGSGVPMVASEHIGPEHYRKYPLQRIALALTPLIASSITVVSRPIMRSYGWWLRRKMTVVANPVKKPAFRGARTGSGKLLLTVGRLAPQKDHVVLISAFAALASEFPDWRLRIAGEGELRGALEAQVKSLALEDRIELPGSISDIDAEYSAADLFVMPSSYESFGLATAEALMHGLAAVGFSDCPGTNDLIRDGENGILVRGEDRSRALATALSRLMRDPAELARLSASSVQSIMDQHGIDVVLDQWESVLQAASRKNGQPTRQARLEVRP